MSLEGAIRLVVFGASMALFITYWLRLGLHGFYKLAIVFFFANLWVDALVSPLVTLFLVCVPAVVFPQ